MEKDIRSRKSSIGLIKIAKDKNTYITNCKLGTVCGPKNPPNISIYYQNLKTKENLQIIQNHSSINIEQQNDKTKTKNNKFKNLAHKINRNQIPLYKQPINQQEQPFKKNKKQLITAQKSKSKYKINHKDKYYTIDEGKKDWGMNLIREDINDSILCCEENLSRDWMSVRTNCAHIQKPKTFQEQIQQFQQSSIRIKSEFQAEALTLAIEIQQKYTQIPHYNCYLKGRQTQLSWIKRAVLIDWMMDVVSQFGNKRQTLAKAISMLDRYLASTINIPLHKLQLVGATCLLIANKLQDNTFSLVDIHQATGLNYSIDQILKYQSIILKTLGWKLNPPTANMWANRLCAQWDLYLQTNSNLAKECLTDNISIILFKNSDQKAYYNYRWLIQYIDFSLLDIHTIQYPTRTLAASFLYLILALRLRIYNIEEVINTFPSTSHYLLQISHFNTFFDNFLQFSFNIRLLDLLPTLQYCSTFLILPLNFDLPLSARNDDAQINFEQFCSFQTRNKCNMVYLQKRNRSFD